MADLDNHLWILTSTSMQSGPSGLVFDVVDNRGQLLERVRVPAGRAIAGFARNGVVYLMRKDGAEGWVIERSRIVTR